MNMQARILTKEPSILKSVTLNEAPKRVNMLSAQLCRYCAMHKVCLVKSVGEDSKEALGAFIKSRKPVQKGQHFYRQGDDFDSVYVVRSGAVKTYYINEKGEEHITGLYLPGELFGMDGIAAGKHNYAAEALDTSAVCEIDYGSLELSFRSHPDIQRRIIEILCSEIYERQQPLLSQRQSPAEERLATFLINISDRLKLRRLSPTEFTLPMSRRDIAGYLGIAGETLSRLFTRFQNRGLLSVNGRSVSISDLSSLQDMSVTVH